MSKFGANIFWIATIFNYLWSSEFGRKKSEKTRKNFINLKVAGNYPSIQFTQVF